jgi:hypothetical protein
VSKATGSGAIFYGIRGPIAAPWRTGSSFLCVQYPLQRTDLQGSGGTGSSCDGTFSLDRNAYVSAHPGALGSPFVPGRHVFAQAWFRNPPSLKTTAFSAAVEFIVRP